MGFILTLKEIANLSYLNICICLYVDALGESAGKNIDDLLIEADKLISETLPYFQTISNKNKVKSLQDVDIIKINSTIKKTQHKNHDTKKVVFNLKNDSKSIKIPEKHSKTRENYGLYY